MRGRSLLQVSPETDANCSGWTPCSLNFSNSNLGATIHHNLFIIKFHHDCNNSTGSRAWGTPAVRRICQILSRRLYPDSVG